MKQLEDGTYVEDPIHGWFGLSYSSYYVLHRSIMQAMPIEWQEKFIDLMDEMEEVIDPSTIPTNFWVRAREGNKFVENPFSNYRHPPEIPYREGYGPNGKEAA